MQRLMACCLLVAAPVLVVAPAVAQPAPAGAVTPQAGAVLTLAQAYRAALEQDATLRAARAGADARRERLPQARAQLLPNVAVSASRNKNDLDSRTPGLGGRAVDSERDYMSGSRALTVRQPLYRPYQWADVRQAEAQVADANAQLEKEVQNLAVRLTSIYLEALLAQDQLELVMQQKQTYTTQLDAARKRFAGGSGVRTDVDEAQARLDLVHANELEARQNVDYTRRALQVLVNQPVSQIARIDPARLKLVRPDPDRLEDWTARAELNSPDLRSLQAQREASRQEIDKARAGHLPTLDAIAQWTYSNSDNVNSIDTRHKNKSIGLQLNVPIYSGGGVSSQVRQTVADLERAEQSLEAARRDLTLRVEKEFRAVTEGVLRIRALEQAVRSNDVLVVSNRRSFEGGARTLVDVLNAEEQRFVALRDLAQARYQYALARVRLQTLSGTGNEVAITEVDSWLKP